MSYGNFQIALAVEGVRLFASCMHAHLPASPDLLSGSEVNGVGPVRGIRCHSNPLRTSPPFTASALVVLKIYISRLEQKRGKLSGYLP